MVKGLVLEARRAHAARVAAGAVGAVDILCCGKRQGEFGHSWLAVKQQRVRDVAAVDHASYLLYRALIAYYVTEFHSFNVIFSL